MRRSGGPSGQQQSWMLQVNKSVLVWLSCGSWFSRPLEASPFFLFSLLPHQSSLGIQCKVKKRLKTFITLEHFDQLCGSTITSFQQDPETNKFASSGSIFGKGAKCSLKDGRVTTVWPVRMGGALPTTQRTCTSPLTEWRPLLCETRAFRMWPGHSGAQQGPVNPGEWCQDHWVPYQYD